MAAAASRAYPWLQCSGRNANPMSTSGKVSRLIRPHRSERLRIGACVRPGTGRSRVFHTGAADPRRCSDARLRGRWTPRSPMNRSHEGSFTRRRMNGASLAWSLRRRRRAISNSTTGSAMRGSANPDCSAPTDLLPAASLQPRCDRRTPGPSGHDCGWRLPRTRYGQRDHPVAPARPRARSRRSRLRRTRRQRSRGRPENDPRPGPCSRTAAGAGRTGTPRSTAVWSPQPPPPAHGGRRHPKKRFRRHPAEGGDARSRSYGINRPCLTMAYVVARHSRTPTGNVRQGFQFPTLGAVCTHPRQQRHDEFQPSRLFHRRRPPVSGVYAPVDRVSVQAQQARGAAIVTPGDGIVRVGSARPRGARARVSPSSPACRSPATNSRRSRPGSRSGAGAAGRSTAASSRSRGIIATCCVAELGKLGYTVRRSGG